MIPAYTESVEILRETIKAVARSDYDKERLIVVLGMEERAHDSRERAEILEREFKDTFFRFETTFHPNNIAREVAGKGANETFATKQVKEHVIDELKI